ncbi:HAD family phosphatase [Patescibacteria group bacterium]|nr:HAD family phosphatase [Patescibacteria group bacterium]
MIDAVADVCGLFDMDGSLLDSEPIKDRAHRETALRLGGILPIDVRRPIGRSLEESAAYTVAQAGIDVPLERYLPIYKRVYRGKLRAHLRPVPGTIDLLKRVRSMRIRCALVTSCDMESMRDSIVLTRIWSFFAVTISADDVTNCKPDPEPYLLALERLKGQPDMAFVLEDTESGVQAAHAAGIPVVAISHRWNRGQNFSAAHTVLDSLKDTNAVIRAFLSALEAG